MTRDHMVYWTFKIPNGISGDLSAMVEWDGPHERSAAEDKARQLALEDPGTRFLVFPYPPVFEAVKSDSLSQLVETRR